MREIKIYRLFFTNADCYKKGIIQTPRGVQVHSTGANNPYLHRYVGPDDGRLGPNQYNNTHNRPGGNVCGNAYIGKLQDGTPAIYQTLPWNMRCWLSANGSKGNANAMGYIGFEICEDNRKNREYFEQVVMGLSVNLVAYLCQEYKIPLENVLDHQELHQKGIGSDHGDISWWLVKFGYNMNDYRLAVKKAMEEGVHVTYINADEKEEEGKEVMYKAKVVAKSGSTVNMRLSASQSSVVVTKVPVGAIVDVTKEVNSTWCQIQYEDRTGYMMSEFLDKVVEVSTPDENKLREIKKKLEEAIKMIDELL